MRRGNDSDERNVYQIRGYERGIQKNVLSWGSYAKDRGMATNNVSLETLMLARGRMTARQAWGCEQSRSLSVPHYIGVMSFGKRVT